MWIKYFLLFYFLLVSDIMNAQGVYMQVHDKESVTKLKLSLNKLYNSTIEAQDAAEKEIRKFQELGYLAASIDSIVLLKDTLRCNLSLGTVYRWAKINSDSIPHGLRSEMNLDQFFNISKPINAKKYNNIVERILRFSENSGYPFAKVFLDQIEQQADSISGHLIWDKGPLIKIDSIAIVGEVSIGIGFIEQFIGIKEGDLYNESIVKNISKKLAELPFAQEEKRHRIYYSTQKTILNIYLKEKNANQADILVGILPNTSPIPGVRNNFQVTGDVKLALVNALSYGERIHLNWQNLQYKSPRLMVETNLPYIGGTVLGTTAKFNYVKNDSSFRTVFGEVALQYITKPNNLLKAFYQTGNSRLITADTNYVKQFKILPANADVSNNSFGLEWQFSRLDYSLAPRKGFSALLNTAVNRRKFIKNDVIEQLQDVSRGTNFAYLYDSLPIQSLSYQAQVSLQFFQPITKQFVCRFNFNGAKIYNPRLFKNELFQIGGYRNLRGFNEAALFVSDYHIITAEPRYYFSRNSYFQLIADYAFLKSFLINSNQWNRGAGFGGGVTLDAKAGLFNVLYAVGNNLENKFSLRNAKIHFGYVNRF
jgi:outer membrane protein assembly factor BamA